MNNKDVFFQKVSIEHNYQDKSNIVPVYYAILRAVLKSLRSQGKIRLPGFGEFRIVKQKPRRIINIADPNRGYINLPATYTIKFSPSEKLKEYIKNLDGHNHI